MIKDFTDLFVWQKAHILVVGIYKLVAKFPSIEKYGLADQMRRASVSITSNIAEGFGRQGTKEKIQFFHMTMGSLTEVRNQIYIARDVGYIQDKIVIESLLSQMIEIQKMMFGLIKASKTRI